jgi:hypothetical protein
MKPIHMNLISPTEAMMTPMTMTETFRKTRRLGWETPSIQLEKRTATGVVAWKLGQNTPL